MAQVMVKGIAPHRQVSKLHLDWLTREGIIARNHRNSGCYMVKWDDRKSLEAWPEKALERVDGITDSH